MLCIGETMDTEISTNLTEKNDDGDALICRENERQIIKERLNLSLPKDLMNYLREDAENNYKSVTCVIIEIIHFNKFLLEAIKKGYKLSLEDPNGKTHYLMVGNLKSQLI